MLWSVPKDEKQDRKIKPTALRGPCSFREVRYIRCLKLGAAPPDLSPIARTQAVPWRFVFQL